MQLPLPPFKAQRAIADYLDTETARIDSLIVKKRLLEAKLSERMIATIDQAIVGTGRETPLRYAVRYREGPGIMAADFRDEGTPLLRIGNLVDGSVRLDGCNFVDSSDVNSRWRHFRIELGDYIVSGSATMGMVSVVDDPAVVGAIPYTGLIILRPATTETFMPFIAAFLRSSLFFDQIDRMRTGMGLQHFGPSHLAQVRLPWPNRDEQMAIVTRLGEKELSISRTSKKLEEQIARLQEHRQALITAAVTGDLEIPGAA